VSGRLVALHSSKIEGLLTHESRPGRISAGAAARSDFRFSLNVDRRQPGKTGCRGSSGSSCGAPQEARFCRAPRDTSINARGALAGPPGRVVDARIAHCAPNGQISSFLRNCPHKTCTPHYGQFTHRVELSSQLSSIEDCPHSVIGTS
jgi:hypothetical protein